MKSASRSYFSFWLSKNRLERKIKRLERQKSEALDAAQKRSQQNKASRRRSDRKFLENSAKALAARTKRAEHARLNTIERQLSTLKIELKHHQAKLEISSVSKWLRLVLGKPER